MGTRGPVAKRKSGVNYASGVPDAPPWLDDVAKAEFDRVVRELEGTLQQPDFAAVVTYAQAFSDVCRLTLELRGREVSEGPQGPVANPLLRFIAQAQRTMMQTGSKLGFSPADRSRINVPTPAQKKNPVAEMLQAG